MYRPLYRVWCGNNVTLLLKLSMLAKITTSAAVKSTSVWLRVDMSDEKHLDLLLPGNAYLKWCTRVLDVISCTSKHRPGCY